MSDQTAAAPPITAQDFQRALRQSDEGLNAFIARVYDEAGAPYKAIFAAAHDRFTTPEQAEAMKIFMGMARVDISLSTGDHKPSAGRINYTGIHGDTPMEGDKSVAKVQGQSLILPRDTCLGCSASKPLAPGYSCDDLSDPAQVRASQLNRAFTALHEIGHSLFPLKILAGELGKEKAEDMNPFAILFAMADVRTNERQADSFAAGLFIRYLGEEGALFVRQKAAGVRYMENGSGANHDTAITLARVMERYGKDPTLFTRASLTGLMEMNVADAQELSPTHKIADTFRRLSGFSPNGYDNPDAAFRSAGQRLQQRAFMQPAQQIMYDKYFRPADEMMMDMTGLAENLQRLTRHSPLDPQAPLGPETAALVAACKAKPGPGTP